MSRLGRLDRGVEVHAERGPVAVTILLLLVLGTQVREVREVGSVAARAFSAAVAMAEEVESRAVVRQVGQETPPTGAEIGITVRQATRSRSARGYAWPPPRAPSRAC